MPKAAAKLKSDLPAAVRAACEERLNLQHELRKRAGDLLDKIEAKDAVLKDLVTTLGHSTKEEFQGGSVSVSGRSDREFKGDLPEIDEAAWSCAPDKQRKAWLKDSPIKLVSTWSKANYGRVTVKMFPAP